MSIYDIGANDVTEEQHIYKNTLASKGTHDLFTLNTL
jgi:hypothetical protein